MRGFCKLILAVFSLLGVQVWAQSAAVAGHQCNFEMVVPGFECTNLFGPADVRLMIMEFQTCENGNIVQLDRQVSGMNNRSQRTIDDLHALSESDISVVYNSRRTHIDDRADDLTFVIPRSAVLRDGDQTVRMTISDRRQMDAGAVSANEWHWVGSFELVNSSGRIIQSGPMSCKLYR